MSLRKESIKKLRAVKAAILAEPEFYNQKCFPRARHGCNSPCCLTGWAIWLESPKTYASRLSLKGAFYDEDLASALGISFEQADRLAYGQGFGPFEAMWGKSGTMEAARAAAKRIEHFIKTGGEE